MSISFMEISAKVSRSDKIKFCQFFGKISFHKPHPNFVNFSVFKILCQQARIQFEYPNQISTISVNIWIFYIFCFVLFVYLFLSLFAGLFEVWNTCAFTIHSAVHAELDVARGASLVTTNGMSKQNQVSTDLNSNFPPKLKYLFLAISS